MIMKCSNCGGALEYDVTTKKLFCKFCFSYFEPSQFEKQIQQEEEKAAKQEAARVGNWNTQTNEQQDGGLRMAESADGGLRLNDAADADAVQNDNEYMDAEIYSCTACGAELMINNVEASTFCAYCGQPTIVFSRVSKCRRPEYIIPFEVTKEEALRRIREKINKGFFVPKEIKNFKVEMLRGIYIPFWLYDVDYKDRMVIRGDVGSGKNKHTYYFYRKAACHLKNLTLDASKRFNDESSERLEPYYLNNSIPFQPEILSGFYADCGDDERGKMDKLAIDRTRMLFENEVFTTVKADNKKITYSSPQYQIKKKPDYALLPAWFLVFREQQTFYTIMVNGQTGKVIGAVPSDKTKERLVFTLLSLVLGIICGLISAAISASGSDIDEIIKLWVIGLIFAGVAFASGHGIHKNYELSQKLTTESDIKRMVTERQDGE